MDKDRFQNAFYKIGKQQPNINNFQLIAQNYITKLHNEHDEIRLEICHCITYNQYQASIVLTNHLIEKFLRSIVILNESGLSKLGVYEDYKTLEPIFEKYVKHTLEPLANVACSRQLISKQQKKDIVDYKNKLRDPFSHGSPYSFLKDSGNMPVMFGSFSKGVGVEDIHSIPIASVLPLHGIIQGAKASKEAIPYFLYVDNMMIEFYKKQRDIVVKE